MNKRFPLEFTPMPSFDEVYQRFVEDFSRDREAAGVPDQSPLIHVNTESWKFVRSLGRGNFGVDHMRDPSGAEFAVKRMDLSSDRHRRKQVLLELKFMLRAGRSIQPNIVRFYGCRILRHEVQIVMELMDACCGYLIEKNRHGMPIGIVGLICAGVVRGLHLLKRRFNMIHRDVRPPNFLLKVDGSVKLCDFGISRELVHSLAKTRDVGCEFYFPPERVVPEPQEYRIQSDVWSLGISLYEMATGKHPYAGMSSFQATSAILNESAPRLPLDVFPSLFTNFVHRCLDRDQTTRANYSQLMLSEFVTQQDMASGPKIMSSWLESMNLSVV